MRERRLPQEEPVATERGVSLTRHACRLLLVAVFTASASYKLIHFFSYIKSAVSLVPPWTPPRAAFVAIPALPFLEALVAVFLIVPRWRKLGSVITLGLLGAFTVMLISAYRHGKIVLSCGCNWPFLKFLAPERLELMLARNALLLIVAWFVVRGEAVARTPRPS